MNYKNLNTTPPPFFGTHEVATQINAVMKRVYVRMFIGLLISAFCALGVASSQTALNIFIGNRIIFWGMFIALFVMAWVIPARLQKMSPGSVLLCFVVFSALMGTTLAPIFLVYKIGTIVYTLFITAGMFGAMSVYGFFTKRNLTGMGTYLFMGLIGLLIAMLVNAFLANNTMEWIISIVGVLLFTGLTAWDTQTIKHMAAADTNPAMADKIATMGALSLYLDFINLFLFLLRLLGGGSRD